MKFSATLLLLFGFLLLACNPEEEEKPNISFPECEGNDVFGLDLFLTSTVTDLVAYLSSQDGTVAYEQEVTPTTAGTAIFFDKEAPCEEVYDLSIGSLIAQDFGSGLFNFLSIDQVASVPDGSAITLFRSFESSRVSIFRQVELIQIRHCPPVDSVYLPYALQGSGLAPRLTFSYSLADSLLSITTQNRAFGSFDGLLSLRTTHDQAWHGQLLNLLNSMANQVDDFRDLFPLTRQSIRVQTEGEVSRLEVHLLTGGNNYRTALLGATRNDQLDYLLPPDSLPIQLEVITTNNLYDYEFKHHYDVLPSEIDLRNPILSISNQKINGLQVSFGASGADIVQLRSDFSESNGESDSNYHTYTGPAQSGVQSIRLPDLSPSLIDNFEGAQDFYERSMRRGYLELIHYPGINGDYQIFLRKVIGSPSNQDWRIKEEYEKLRARLL